MRRLIPLPRAHTALVSSFPSVLLHLSQWCLFVGLEFYKSFQILCEKVSDNTAIYDGSGHSAKVTEPSILNYFPNNFILISHSQLTRVISESPLSLCTCWGSRKKHVQSHLKPRPSLHSSHRWAAGGRPPRGLHQLAVHTLVPWGGNECPPHAHQPTSFTAHTIVPALLALYFTASTQPGAFLRRFLFWTS